MIDMQTILKDAPEAVQRTYTYHDADGSVQVGSVIDTTAHDAHVARQAWLQVLDAALLIFPKVTVEYYRDEIKALRAQIGGL